MAAPLVARFGTRQVVAVEGPDATAYLQGQLSQDIDAIAIDDSALSLILSPQGKIDAWVRVTRIANDSYLIDVDAGFGAAVVTRLNRFLLRTAATITLTDLGSVSFRAVNGDDAALIPVAIDRLPDDDIRGLPALGWPLPGLDVIGDEVTLRAFADRISAVDELDDDGWQRLRIRSGVPAMGAELDADTIPATAGIVEESVSFTKGCYTGQELVARIDSRGNRVPRFLCFGVATGPAPTGADLVDPSGAKIGTITSSASDPTEADPNQRVILAYLNRGNELPLSAAIDAGDGTETSVRLQRIASSP